MEARIHGPTSGGKDILTSRTPYNLQTNAIVEMLVMSSPHQRTEEYRTTKACSCSKLNALLHLLHGWAYDTK